MLMNFSSEKSDFLVVNRASSTAEVDCEEDYRGLIWGFWNDICFSKFVHTQQKSIK